MSWGGGEETGGVARKEPPFILLAFLHAGADIASAREQGVLSGALASFDQAEEVFSQEPRWHRLTAEPR